MGTCDIDLEKLYQDIVWPLAKIYGNTAKAFKAMMTNPSEVFKKLSKIPEEEVQNVLIKNISRKMSPKQIKITRTIYLQSSHKHGVNAIKEAMRAAQDISSEKLQVKIILDSPPKYV